MGFRLGWGVNVEVWVEFDVDVRVVFDVEVGV